MSGKARPSLLKKTLENVKRCNLSQSDKDCSRAVFEKQIPKKPTPHIVKGGKKLIGNGWWCNGTTIYRCPNCNEFISRTYDYCNKCGQALDWSDTE